ncbi:MAG: hypothetical protein U0271_22255 [Polyangiaceae bacterium]
MSVHSEAITYHWNQMDVWAAFIGMSVTPYKIPAGKLNKPKEYRHQQVVDLSLALSTEPATVARFFRDGYEWITVPEDVQAGTLLELFTTLWEKDKIKFAHFDPMMIMATTTARNVANIKGMSATSLLDSSLQPFGDLAALHFEYWGNSALRAEVLGGTFQPTEVLPFGLEALAFPMPWFGSDPLAAPLAMLVPQTIPTEKNGKKLEKVLARKPIKGAPIRAVATAKGTTAKTVHVTSVEPPRIELDGFAKQVFGPFFLDDNKLGQSKIRFRITIPLPAIKTVIQIFHASNCIFEESHEGGEFLIPGMHIWTWDGFDQDGVLDTGMMKQNMLSARVTVVDMMGRTAVATTEMGTGPDSIRWVDVRLDKRDKTAQIAVYAQFSNPSDVEIATLRIPLPGDHILGNALTAAGSAMGSNPGSNLLSMIPGLGGAMPEIPGVNLPELINNDELAIPIHVPSVLDIQPDQFTSIKSAIIEGIGFHWSRTVHIDGAEWTAMVSCRERSTDSVRTFLCKALPKALQDLGIGDGSPINDANTGGRSVNLATLGEGLPIINIWDDTDTYDERAETGAHELGHSVLRETHNFYYSLTHKGSSTVGQESSLEAPEYPLTGDGAEIDIMLYTAKASVVGHSVNKRPDDWRERTRAVEEDVLGLIWMSRVVFG